jgi:3-deoxy-manno-octulosonate cytidylyltransferase (CMP-KDO synthetase)
MNILALIPARMGSSRFPGKPLAEILGKPMIGHVFKNVASSNLVSKTVVATCDLEIFNYIESIGGEAVMTSNSHERASDRCAEALLILEEKYNIVYDIVVMIQGDEPMINSKMIYEAMQPMLTDKSIKVINLLGKIKDQIEFKNRNCIKVVTDLNNNALYFSREPIPSQSHRSENIMGKQICIIPFKRDFLLEYTKLKPSPLEIAESIDMNRVLEHGFKVRMVKTEYDSQAVDTAEDLKKVENIMTVNFK